MSHPPERCDVAVVGGGIVGLAVARELTLREPGTAVAVLEREAAVAAHQTSHNSGVVHAGIYYRPGSLKARLCVEGARELRAYCEQRGLPYRAVGKVIVALDDSEMPALDALRARAATNGVPGVELVDGRRLREIEPAVRGVAALHSPTTAITDYARVARAYAEDVSAAGGTVSLGCGVETVSSGRAEAIVRHARGVTVARHAIVCAGAFAGRLAPDDPGMRFVHFRGAYDALAPQRAARVRGLVYPVPDPALPFLGVHFTRTVDERVIVGPTALAVAAPDAYRLTRISLRDARSALGWPGTWRMARRWWRTAVREVAFASSRAARLADARRYLPDLRPGDLVPAGAGVRAQPVAHDGSLIDDFVLTAHGRALHVISAPSPAATSSLALGRLIVERASDALGMGDRPARIPHRAKETQS